MAEQNKNSIRMAFPSYRVFIYGHEVTEDVVSITTEMHDGAAPNMCQITLTNERDRYTVTTRDVMRINGLNNVHLSSLGSSNKLSLVLSKYNILVGNDNGVASSVTDYVMDEVKEKILVSKGHHKAKTPDRKDIFGRPLDPSQTKYFGEEIKMYPIMDGSPIFHPMDSVRVFFRDPFNSNDWYHMFCGFVSSMGESCDQNNTKTLTISVEDPTKLLRYTRVAINPGIYDPRSISDSDLKVNSVLNKFLGNLTLPQMFYLMIFGADKTKIYPTEYEGAPKSAETKLGGVGHFSYDASVIAEVGNESGKNAQSSQTTNVKDGYRAGTNRANIGGGMDKPVAQFNTDLTAWQALLDHKVYVSDIRTMATDEDRKDAKKMADRYTHISGLADTGSNAEYPTGGIIEYIGTHPGEYPVDGGRLMLLIPRGLSSNNADLLEKSILNNPYMRTNWTTVGQTLYEVIERFQFEMYCTPRGDIVVEPPMFDADPDFFGASLEDGMTLDDLRNRSPNYAHAFDVYGNEDTAFRRPYALDFIVPTRDTYSWDYTFSDDKVYTMAIASHAIIPNLENTAGFIDRIPDSQSVVQAKDLMPLYGTRIAPVTPRGFIATKEAAQLYARICLDRLNSDARTLSVKAIPNIKAWLNRPVYFESRNLIGTTKNVAHSLQWGMGGDMSTNMSLNVIRTWGGEVKVPGEDDRNGELNRLNEMIEDYKEQASQSRKSSGFDVLSDGTKIPIPDEDTVDWDVLINEAENARNVVVDTIIKPIIFTPIGGNGGRLLNYQILWGRAPVPAEQPKADAPKVEAPKKAVSGVSVGSRDLSSLVPEFRAAVEAFLKDVADAGYKIIITYAFRTIAEQNALYAKGRTEPGKSVTNARGGESAHNFRMAIDFVFIDDKGKANWNAPRKDWEAVGVLGEKRGMTWGGRWKSIVDLPHLEWPKWKAAQAEWRRTGNLPTV